MNGTLITLAPTGAEHEVQRVPGLPITPEQLGDVAASCEHEGAGMIHVHARDRAGQPSLDLGILSEHMDAVKASSDLIIQLSTGGSVEDTFDDRVRVLELQPESCSLTLGTVNFGTSTFMNPWGLIRSLYEAANSLHVMPEFEVFDLGHLWTLERLIDDVGPTWNGRVHVDFVLGVPGALPGTAQALTTLVASLPDYVTSWSATGIGRSALSVLLGTLAHEGNVRVGLEDTVWLAQGKPATNAALVNRAAEAAILAQRPPLSPRQGRVLLGLVD